MYQARNRKYPRVHKKMKPVSMEKTANFTASAAGIAAFFFINGAILGALLGKRLR